MLRFFVAAVVVMFAAVTSALAASPSFDCKKAKQPDEVAICRDGELAANDITTTRLFYALKKIDRTAALSIAREFLADRKKCFSDVYCIKHLQVGAIGRFGMALGAAQVAVNSTKVTGNDGWQPGEIVTEGESGWVLPELRVGRYRQGTSPGGLEYRIYKDGSGSVRPRGGGVLSGWSITCKVDAMDDRRRCHVAGDDARVMAFFEDTDAVQIVCIVGHDFPGRTGAIRVDKNPPLTTSDGGCVSGSFADQLERGRVVTTRRVEWPYDYSVDHTADLSGFADALDLARYIRQNIDRITF